MLSARCCTLMVERTLADGKSIHMRWTNMSFDAISESDIKTNDSEIPTGDKYE
jgi:hypothetical protein